MRKAAKKQIENFINFLLHINEHLQSILSKDVHETLALIAETQEGLKIAYHMIMESEGKAHAACTEVEKYQQQLDKIQQVVCTQDILACEQAYEELQLVWKHLSSAISQIKVRQEVVFMPYKAAMWDSLESVWMAAEADSDCDAYVVPLPYYDKKEDRSFGDYHYEADLFPTEVPITHYDDYDLASRKPDVIYIHNPYDFANNITSIDPRFYSKELKKYTDCLVYIPYYSTAGGMAETQEKCPAYYHADYIVIQAEKYRKFFDPALPDEKFLALGSPKFDRVIRICNNPPEPPQDWKAKMQGKKVYFFNTSLGGMLTDTENFFKKMQYVFDTFRGREDACLLWRPHPLFESTIETARTDFLPIYKKLKQDFLEHELGIYDTTPDIANTIALCDAYIGDAGTSVTSLFGVAGKPIFILNNRIHSLPEDDDWRGEIIRALNLYYFNELYTDDDWKVTQGNKLYHAAKSDYHYHYVCDLCEYAVGDYFNHSAITIDNRQYVCPINGQEIVVVENERIVERIPLIKELEQAGAFWNTVAIGTNLYLIPRKYPAIVRYDTQKKSITYIRGYNDVFVKYVPEAGGKLAGGWCEWKNQLLLASPTDNKVLAIDNTTGKIRKLVAGTNDQFGCMMMVPEGEDIWMLPYNGKIIVKWTPLTGECREYTDFPENFVCKQWPQGYLCEERPLNGIVFDKNYAYFSPGWGNMFLRLDKQSGKFEEWILPMQLSKEVKSDYYNTYTRGFFTWKKDSLDTGIYRYFSLCDAKLYDINPKTKEYCEIPIVYDIAELKLHAIGFSDQSDWMKYCCVENAFHTLADFLNGMLTGAEFKREKQIRSYGEINASCDGDAGKRIHMTVDKK